MNEFSRELRLLREIVSRIRPFPTVKDYREANAQVAKILMIPGVSERVRSNMFLLSGLKEYNMCKLCSVAGIHTSYLSQIWKNKKKLQRVSFTVFHNIAMALETDIDVLFSIDLSAELRKIIKPSN